MRYRAVGPANWLHRQFFMELWAAREKQLVALKGADYPCLTRPAMGVCGGIQPAQLKLLWHDLQQGDGFAARILLVD